jgi:hypothetical protein
MGKRRIWAWRAETWRVEEWTTRRGTHGWKGRLYRSEHELYG